MGHPSPFDWAVVLLLTSMFVLWGARDLVFARKGLSFGFGRRRTSLLQTGWPLELAASCAGLVLALCALFGLAVMGRNDKARPLKRDSKEPRVSQ
jgi:hypothetical protein